jgi:hypothetical protein
LSLPGVLWVTAASRLSATPSSPLPTTSIAGGGH